MFRLLPAIFALSLAGCGSKGGLDSDVRKDTDVVATATAAATGTGTGAATGTGTGATPGAQDCAWVGTWVADEVLCGERPFADEFFSYYTGFKLEIAHGQAFGCEIDATWTNEDCIETEHWFVDPEPNATQVLIEAEGISVCEPEMCQFKGQDEPCELGDRVREAQVLVEQRVSTGKLSFTHLAAYSAPTCSDVFRVRFVRQ